MISSFLSSLFGCSQENKSNTITPPITKPVENITASIDQKTRRAKSEKICESNGVPIYKNPNSLFVSSEKEVKLRNEDEVVDRTIALLYLGLKSEGLEQVHLDKMEEEYGISSKLSPVEKEYAYSSNPTDQQRTNANWRYESLHVLLWALGYIDELVYPNQMCNVADDVKIIYELGPDEFRKKSKLRSKEEILDQADLILRLDWACVNARVKNEVAPGGLNSSVVYERHYALNWLIKYLNQDWDNVSTDT
ncbi:hypothetical protein PEPS_37600 (plasmid) [Persicobacter psychrovividus]|uniref:DUF4272 domain-containing protein n=2 Tax=Persicobacter psychrovividus TaxID=387638 RepID=A0ABM7VKH7_9BACT|nr:hypothetical protein PEPS_37600 [Persicobacter psychrovividus]